MPYIPEGLREPLNYIVDHLEHCKVKADGDLNYILFKYCKDHITPSYNNYKNYIGELRQCATEIERRLLSDYEDQKLKENGDV